MLHGVRLLIWENKLYRISRQKLQKKISKPHKNVLGPWVESRSLRPVHHSLLHFAVVTS